MSEPTLPMHAKSVFIAEDGNCMERQFVSLVVWLATASCTLLRLREGKNHAIDLQF
jgi:hypothetical protein